MKKCVFVGLLAFTICGVAQADLYVDISSSGGPWPRSPYIITPVAGPGVPNWMPLSFSTFCIERYQTFTSGRYRATIDNDILYAGGSSPVLLQDNVKKIYAAYLNNALGSFSGNAIQDSVWGARGYSGYSIDTQIQDIIGIGNLSLFNPNDINGWTNVKALNLWGRNGQDKQSQLVMTPVPGAFLIGLIGLGVAGVRLRKHS